MSGVSYMGLMIALGVLYLGLHMASDNVLIFWDFTSAFIVLGGTFAAMAISFRLDRIFTLIKIFFRHVSGMDKVNYSKLITEIVQIANAYRKGESLDNVTKKIKDPFFKEAVTLLADEILPSDQLVELLDDRVENTNYRYQEDANKMKVLGKFPPAFGMMGTTIGMIVLLSRLGGSDAIKMIGPAMSVCLITTLYGVVIANLGFLPVAENLLEAAKANHIKNTIILEGIKHILEKSNPILVVEDLNSYLPPGQRLDWKQVVKE
jgi:chemotaxis protein MotA